MIKLKLRHSERSPFKKIHTNSSREQKNYKMTEENHPNPQSCDNRRENSQQVTKVLVLFCFIYLLVL